MYFNSIIKVINTKAYNASENDKIAKKHLNYILRKDATSPDLRWMNVVEPDDILDSFGFFAKAAGKNTGRPLKHIVLSYSTGGSKRLNWEEYLSVTKEIAKFYSSNYQMVAVVHNNIPKRPHAHIVMDCFNVATEKKFSESVNELEKLKDFVDKILLEHHIPLLRRKKNLIQGQSVPLDEDKSNEDKSNEDEYDDGIFLTPISCIPVSVDNTQQSIQGKEIDKFFQSSSVKENFAQPSLIDCSQSVRKEILQFFTDEPANSEVQFSFKNILGGSQHE